MSDKRSQANFQIFPFNKRKRRLQPLPDMARHRGKGGSLRLLCGCQDKQSMKWKQDSPVGERRKLLPVTVGQFGCENRADMIIRQLRKERSQSGALIPSHHFFVLLEQMVVDRFPDLDLSAVFRQNIVVKYRGLDG